MDLRSRLTLALLAGLVLLIVTGCPTPVEQNEPGPGGLPKGIVDQGTPPDTDSDYPVYPGATKRASNTYETTDSLDSVASWYVESLGVPAVAGGEHGQTRTLTTEVYEVVLVPMEGGGTEIHFTPMG